MLLTSEEPYRLFVEGVKDCSIVFLDTAGHVMSLNGATERIVGYCENEIAGAHLSRFYTPEDIARGQPERELLAASDKGYCKSEGWKVRKDGARFLAHIVITSLTDKTGNRFGFSLTMRDVTARRRAEQQHRRSEAYLAEAQRLSHTGSWAWNIVTGELLWSNEHFRICGVDPEKFKLTIKSARELIHPEDRVRADENCDRAVHERRDLEEDLRILRPDGTIRYVHSLGRPFYDDSGEVTEYVGTIIDNTERKQNEDKLRESERRFRGLAEAIPHHVWSFRTDGTMGYWNRRLVEYTALTPKELHDGAWSALHPDDMERVKTAWKEAWARRVPYEGEERIRGRDGSYRRFLVRAVPIPDERGEVVEWLGTDTDIEERRRAEEALQEAQSELAHVGRVTTMGELAASIAHEVNQPLSAIVTDGGACLQWLSEAEPDLAEARSAATRMIEEAIRASELIARIRGLINKSPPQQSTVRMNELITEVLALTRAEILKHEVSVRTEFAADLLDVRGDPVQLKQVLVNVIVNALEAIGPTIGEPRELLLQTQNQGSDQILVAVRDSGIGINASTVEALFKAFVTTKPGGMGMGLAISRSLIEAHGGRLWAVPNNGRGATFQFTLPAVA